MSQRLYTTVYKLFPCHYRPSFFFQLQTLISKTLIDSPRTPLLSLKQRTLEEINYFGLLYYILVLCNVSSMGIAVWKTWKRSTLTL